MPKKQGDKIHSNKLQENETKTNIQDLIKRSEEKRELAKKTLTKKFSKKGVQINGDNK